MNSYPLNGPTVVLCRAVEKLLVWAKGSVFNQGGAAAAPGGNEPIKRQQQKEDYSQTERARGGGGW